MLLVSAARVLLALLAPLTWRLTLRLWWLIPARLLFPIAGRFNLRGGLQLELVRDELIHIARLRTDF